MPIAQCKNCEAEFSNQAHLIEHWNKHHKHQNCLRCYTAKNGSSNNLFCPTCSSDLSRPPLNLSRLEKVEKEILRSAARAQRWEWRTQNLLALRQQILGRNGHGSFSPSLVEYCGHGNRRGQCLPCNPIFEKQTEKTMQEAMKSFQERTKAELEKQPKLKQAKKDDCIEIDIDD